MKTFVLAVPMFVAVFLTCGFARAQAPAFPGRPAEGPSMRFPTSSILPGTWKVKATDEESFKLSVWTFSEKKLDMKDVQRSISVPYKIIHGGDPVDATFKFSFGVFSETLIGHGIPLDNDTLLLRLTRGRGEPVRLVLCREK